MRITTCKFLSLSIIPSVVLSMASVLTVSQVAWGQDDMSSESDENGGSLAPVAAAVVDPDAVRHGIGIRTRYTMIPQGMIELFTEEAASGVGQPAFGLDYIRRKADFELSVGFEYGKLAPDNGYFVESGGSTAEPGTVDFVEFDGLGWVLLDVNILLHKPITKDLTLRYGGILGWGVVIGDIYSTDAVCLPSGDAQNDCTPAGVREKEDFFRYPPIIGFQAGLQYMPADNVAINLELGIRTLVPYAGLGLQFFL